MLINLIRMLQSISMSLWIFVLTIYATWVLGSNSMDDQSIIEPPNLDRLLSDLRLQGVNDTYSNHCFVQQIVTNISYESYLHNKLGYFQCLRHTIIYGISSAISYIDNIIDLEVVNYDASNMTNPISDDLLAYNISAIPSTNRNISIQYFLRVSDEVVFTEIVSLLYGAIDVMNAYIYDYSPYYGAYDLHFASFEVPLTILNVDVPTPSSSPVSYPFAAPIAAPTEYPTFYSTLEPSGIPTFHPSSEPSQFPTSRPTPTAAPNSRSFVFVDTIQTIQGPGYNNYLSDIYIYTLTLTSTISSCIAENLNANAFDITVLSFSVRPQTSVIRPSTTDTLSLDYTVSVRGGYSLDSVGMSLYNYSVTGKFDAILHSYAFTNGVDSLQTAKSSMLSYTESNPFRSSDSGGLALAPAYIALTVIVVVLGVPFIAYVYYSSFKKDTRKAGRGLELPIEPGQDELNSLFYKEYEPSDRATLGDVPLVNPMTSSNHSAFGTVSPHLSPAEMRSYGDLHADDDDSGESIQMISKGVGTSSHSDNGLRYSYRRSKGMDMSTSSRKSETANDV